MNSITTIMPLSQCYWLERTQDEISIVLYLQPVGSQEAQKILLARGTACISSQLCPIVTMFASHFTFLHSKLVLHSFESLFSGIRIHLFIFIWSCTSSWQDLRGLIKYYRLEVQLACLVNFAQFSLWSAPHLIFLHSKLQTYPPWNHFLQQYIFIFFFNLVLYL